MAWGKKVGNVGAGPYVANYNRNFDTHTAKGSDQAFAVNPPDLADSGPQNYSGLGTHQPRQYRNPVTVEVSSVPRQDGYLGNTVGPRDMHTGNAPSGGYTTLPGLGFTANQPGVVGAQPDNRRINPRNHADDWEENQRGIHYRRDDETRYRRSENVEEDWSGFPLPSLRPGAGEINAIEDSPYRRDWPEPNRITMRTNPNRFRNHDNWDQTSSYKNSGSRYLNGMHYSFAEHNSLNPYVNQVEGGSAVRSLRNTYRLDPQPWDTTNTDSPQNTPGYETTTSLTGGAYGSAHRL